VPSEPTTSSIFCRHCGYNLSALPQNRCPECGRPFDPNNPRTFSKHSGSPVRRHWAKRIVVSLLAFLLLATAAGLSLWWPWHREQVAMRMVQRSHGHLHTETVGPQWLQSLLGRRGGFLLERVDGVRLYGPWVTDTDLVPLGNLKELQSLDLSASQVTDTGLERLPELKGLRTLYLGGTNVTDAGMEHLANLKELQSLSLGATKITDAGLGSLKGFGLLQMLYIEATKVTDAGLENLKDLKDLQLLFLSDTQVTDAGLEHLNGLKRLERLFLVHTKVTDAGVAALKKALPGCIIYR
jgi:hypothetical protein